VGEIGPLPEVDRRVVEGCGNIGVGGKQVHVISARHSVNDPVELLKVGDDEVKSGIVERTLQMGFAAGDEVVIHDNLISGSPQQRVSEVAADESGAPCDE